jgi:hypothetical protein
MPTDIKIVARIRKLLEAIDAEVPGGDPRDITLTPQLEQLVASAAAPYREIVRAGRAFFVNTTTAVASIVALPTTAVTLALYNNEPDGGRAYVIDWVGGINIVAGAATGQSEIIANLGQVRAAVPTDAALAIKKLNGMGGGNVDSRARTIVGGTALDADTGQASRWFPLGPAVGKPGAVAVGPSLWVPVDGRIICPPGRYFALHTFSDVVTDTFQLYVAWHEVQTQLG